MCLVPVEYVPVFCNFVCQNIFVMSKIPSYYLSAASVIIAIAMSVLDSNVTNVALPSLSKEFGVSPDTSIWIVNAYQMAIIMTLVIFATVGDIYGYRKVFLRGMTVFTLASVLCAVSTSFPMLIVSRVLQGFGAASIMGVNTALIRLIYPPEILGRGMSLNTMAVAVSAAAGPTIAGFILSALSWHWLFAINIPLGIVAYMLGRRMLPDNVPSAGKSLDRLSCVGNALTFGFMIYAFEGVAHHENRTVVALSFVAFVLSGFFYFRRQFSMVRRGVIPLLPVDLMKIPIFTLSVLTSICSFMAQMLAMVSLPFYMQDMLHFSAVETGLLITPWPLATLVTAPVAGRLVEKIHPGALGAAGMTLFSSGLLLLFFLPGDACMADIAWRIAICGAGFGLFQTPNNYTIVSSAPVSRSGGASGMLAMARLIGQTLGTTGVAIVFSLMAHTTGSRLCLAAGAVMALFAGLASVSRVTHKIGG